jgi:uncharacterized OB-fold protein
VELLSSETTVKNYLALLNDRKLCAAKCTECNLLMIPPRLVCPNCLKKKTVWAELSGRGSLKSFTVIHIAGTSYSEDVPYIVAVVELEEGPTVTSRLVGVNPLKPEEIHVGDAVVADFEEVPESTPDEQQIRLVFHPA